MRLTDNMLCTGERFLTFFRFGRRTTGVIGQRPASPHLFMAGYRNRMPGFLSLILFLTLISGCGLEDRYGSEVTSDGEIIYSEFWTKTLSGEAVPADRMQWFVRWDLLVQAGYEPESLERLTWQEWADVGRRVYEVTGYRLCVLPPGSTQLLRTLLASADISLYREDGCPFLSENEGFFEAVSFYRQLLSEGLLGFTESEDVRFARFVDDRRYAGTIADSSLILELETLPGEATLWTALPLPLWESVTLGEEALVTAPEADDALEEALRYMLERLSEDPDSEAHLKELIAVAQALAEAALQGSAPDGE